MYMQKPPVKLMRPTVNWTYGLLENNGGGVSVRRRNLLNTSIIKGWLISNVRCKNNPFKVKSLNKAMFAESYTQNSKIERNNFAKDARFYSLYEDI